MKRYFSKLILILAFTLTLIPFALKAQNTGPVAPEAMSFEPVDATDMVNLATGDMSYVIPIMNVPGPGGGYPMALSYHGGVAIDQEASWVGLGWSINPGAINRTISGFPDDWNSDKYFEYIYNPGGTINFNSFGIYIPLQLLGGIPSIGVNFTWGDYSSFGGSIGYGPFSVSFNDDGSFGLGYGFNPIKGSPVSIGVNISVSAEAVAIGGSVGVDLIKGEKLNLGQNMVNTLSPGIGISLSSKNGLAARANLPVSFQQFSSSASKNDWTINQTSSGVNLVLISWGKTTVRYWLFKQELKYAFGSIYTNQAYSCDNDSLNYHLMDVHSLVRDYNAFIEPDQNIFKENLLLPSPDIYGVSGQGISGSMSPRYEDLTYLRAEGFGDNNAASEWLHHYTADKCFYFREFGNHTPTFPPPYNVSAFPNFYFDTENASDYKVKDFNIDSNSDIEGLISSTLESNRIYDSHYYNSTTNRQVTGNYVEWFTNNEISSATNSIYQRGFIETDLAADNTYTNPRSNESFFPKNGIGAISITTPNGMTYHYSLPVYQFEEFLRVFDKTNIVAYTEQRRMEPYAYTWLLTSITGPDYIDRGGANGAANGQVDDTDLGYWVKFNYGKWTDGYVWQLPANNTNFQFPYHVGRKQIYYLNSVRTPSHTAYFIKSLRNDGKGSDGSGYNVLRGTHLFEDVNEHPSCGFYDCHLHVTNEIRDNFTMNETNHPVFKLDKIVLVSNDKPILSNGTGEGVLCGSMVSDWHRKVDMVQMDIQVIDFDRTDHLFNFQYYGKYLKNILDNNDYPANYDNNGIRIINFNYDYSLNNKLSLKSLEVLGKGAARIIPPYIFNYVINKPNGGKDLWGFNKGNNVNSSDDLAKNDADLYSLNSITTPIGTNIQINYESDTYIKEALLKEKLKHQNAFTANITERNPLFFKFSIGSITAPIKNVLIRGHLNIGYTEVPIVKDRINQDFKVKLYCPTVESYDATAGTVIIKMMYNLNQEIDKITSEDFTGEYINSFIIEDLVYESVEPKVDKYGGGLRVSSIRTMDPLIGTTYETDYVYKNGQTSYAPKDFDFFIPYFSELPGPGVIYSEVEVQNKVNGQLAGDVTTYRFNNYDDKINITLDQFDREIANESNLDTKSLFYAAKKDYTKGTKRTTNTVEIVDALDLRGTLDEKIVKNQQGQELSHTKNYYAKGNEIQQSFLTSKQTKKAGTTTPSNFSFCTSKITRNYVLEKVEEIVNDRKNTTEYNSYDPASGSVLTTKTTNANDDQIESSIVPAYLKYPSMGSKVWNINNKNMLTQEATATTKKLVGSSWKTIASSVQTWYNGWDYYEFADGFGSNYVPTTDPNSVWRKFISFTWKGDIEKDGTYKNFTPYNFALPWPTDNCANGWLRTATVSKYNHFSTPIEVLDANSKYNSSQTSIRNNQTISVASNATLFEATHCSFEDAPLEGTNYYGFDGGFVALKKPTDVQRLSSGTGGIEAHTGDYYLKLSNNYGLQLNLNAGGCCIKSSRKYRFSVWVHNSTLSTIRLSVAEQVGSSTTSTTSKLASELKNTPMGNWVLLNMDFQTNSATQKVVLSIYGNPIIDDVRLQPIDGAVTAYTYDDAGNVSAILNNDNFAVKYNYDAGGRLIATYKETPNGFKKVSENKYKYARSNYVIDFSYSPSSAPVYSTLTLTATDAGPGAKYQWVIDGTSIPSVLSTAYKVYQWSPIPSSQGKVTLNVIDADGKTNSVSKTISVLPLSFKFPVAGSIIYASNQAYIEWTSSPGTYKVELIKIINFPVLASPILLGTVTSNYFVWSVPMDADTNSQYFIRLTRMDNNEILESIWFTITPN